MVNRGSLESGLLTIVLDWRSEICLKRITEVLLFRSHMLHLWSCCSYTYVRLLKSVAWIFSMFSLVIKTSSCRCLVTRAFLYALFLFTIPNSHQKTATKARNNQNGFDRVRAQHLLLKTRWPRAANWAAIRATTTIWGADLTTPGRATATATARGAISVWDAEPTTPAAARGSI